MPARVGARRQAVAAPVPTVPLGVEILWNATDPTLAKFDLWIIWGQSNGFSGRYILANPDRVVNPRIWKLPNTNGSATGFTDVRYIDRICAGIEPSEGFNNFITPTPGYTAGFGKSFAENLLAQAPSQVAADSNVLFWRFNLGGTGFFNTTQPNWVPDSGSLYDGMIASVKWLLLNNPQIQVRGILGHQGEEDVGAIRIKFKSKSASFTTTKTLTGATSHKTATIKAIVDNGTTGVLYVTGAVAGDFTDGEVITDNATGSALADGSVAAVSDAEWYAYISAFAARFRSDLGIPDCPFIMGGLSPAQVSYFSMTSRILGLPNNLAWSGVFNPRDGGQSGYPGDTLGGDIGLDDEPSSPFDNVHFAGVTHRGHIGARYLKAHLSSLTHNNPGGADNASTVPAAVSDLAATADDTFVTLDFTPPDNGGAVISGYDAQTSPTGAGTWTDAPQRFSGKGRKLAGLTNDVAIDIRIRAKNQQGPAATWSNVVTVTPAVQWQAEATSLFVLDSVQRSAASKVAINAFIRGCKNAYPFQIHTAVDLWAKLDMWQYYRPKNGEQGALLDWKTQGRTVAKSGSPTWAGGAGGGYTAAVNTNRILTGYNPGDGGTYNLKQTSAMIAVGVETESQSANPDLAVATGAGLRIFPRDASDLMHGCVNDTNGSDNVPNATSVGRFYMTRRTSSNGTKRAYRNGVSVGTMARTSAAVANAQVQALGSTTTLSTGRTVWFVAAGAEMSDVEIAAFDALVAQLDVALQAAA